MRVMQGILEGRDGNALSVLECHEGHVPVRLVLEHPRLCQDLINLLHCAPAAQTMQTSNPALHQHNSLTALDPAVHALPWPQLHDGLTSCKGFKAAQSSGAAQAGDARSAWVKS